MAGGNGKGIRVEMESSNSQSILDVVGVVIASGEEIRASFGRSGDAITAVLTSRTEPTI